MKCKVIYPLLSLICLGLLTHTTTSTPLEREVEPRNSSPEKYNSWEKYYNNLFPSKNSHKNKHSGNKKSSSGNKKPFFSGNQNPFSKGNPSGNQNQSSKKGNPSSSSQPNQPNNIPPNPPKNQPTFNPKNKSTCTSTSADKSNPTATYAARATGTSTLSSYPTNLPPLNLSTSTSPGIFEPFGPLDYSKGPQTREFTFTLKRTTLNPDGYSRVVWAVNGQYPGPIIRCNKGDTIKLTVINQFGDSDATGIHMHGLFQNQTTWFDGVPGMTQCPQTSGQTFTYTTTVDQYGTYWYHSHFVAQYVDGLKGPIIVQDPDDPYKNSYDCEYVMTVSDWYHEPTGNFLPYFRSDKYRGNDPVPDSGEISGVGHYDCSTVTDGTPCVDKGYATYKVRKGKRYRFRIINTSAMAHFTVSIDKHQMEIIEIDGNNVEKNTVDSCSINIAQRYSVIVNCTQDVGNYWIRATISRCSIPYQPGDPGTINSNSTLNYNVLGILRYEGAPETNPNSTALSSIPTSVSANCYDQDASTLKPYPPNSPPKKYDHNMTFAINVVFMSSTKMLAAIVNGQSYSPDFSNPTIQKLQNGQDPSQFPASDNAYAYDIPSNSVVQIVMINNENRTHPFHMHGHAFWIICQGEPGTYNTNPKSLPTNLVDPPMRDVVTLKPLSTTLIWYITDNPGVWAYHCHIEWHVEMGMVVQFVESPDILTRKLLSNMPQELSDLCSTYSNSTNPLENDSTDKSSSSASIASSPQTIESVNSMKPDTIKSDQPSGTVPNPSNAPLLLAPSNYNPGPAPLRPGEKLRGGSSSDSKASSSKPDSTASPSKPDSSKQTDSSKPDSTAKFGII
ncbi:28852_t:CDS:2 [Dentiscutata erythropus]|uniref:28852_t:CDS:1 n=1 Tax=Dentiscutata erythropus TaxID=1348616 RepID=A0A9N9AM40_9GLOM|nr:28852_t:CDS:2 [Dentiscutata erythropus]